MKTILLSFTALLLLLCACDTVEIGQAKDVNPDAVWQQYYIWYDEGDDSLFCRAQFRFAGPKGTSLVLDSTSNVMLDDELLQVDSTTFSGASYVKVAHPTTFVGKHHYVYTDIKARTFKNNFDFIPFLIKDSLPKIINPHNDLKVRFSGLEDKEIVQIFLSDTSYSNSLDSNFKLTKQCISIPSSYLAKMVAGPLTLRVGYEKKLPLQETTKEGGEINLIYTIKPRTIMLGDSWE